MAFKIPSGVNKVQFSIRVDEDNFKIMVKYAIESMKEDELKELINKFE